MNVPSVFDSPYVEINIDSIRHAIQEQDLKRYWVAEMAGIHKTTLRRWLSGDIKRVREDHARNVAQVLTLPLEQILHSKKHN